MDKKFAYFAAFCAYFIWGTAFPFSKMVIPPLSSFTYVFIRSLIGGLILLSVILLKKEMKSWLSSLIDNFWKVAVYSFGPFAMSYTIQFYAIEYTTAINQSIIAQTSIFWLMFFNFLFFKHKPSQQFVVGVIIGFIGVVFVLTNSEFQFSPETLRGDLISILSFISWSTYTLFSKPIMKKMDPLHMMTSVFLMGSLFLFPFVVLSDPVPQISQLDLSQWWIMIYLGCIGSGLAYILHLFALSHKDIHPEYVSYFGIIMPMISAVFGILVLDENLTPRSLLGMGFVVMSVLIVQLKIPKKGKKN